MDKLEFIALRAASQFRGLALPAPSPAEYLALHEAGYRKWTSPNASGPMVRPREPVTAEGPWVSESLI